ncbi:MAG: hypothetical protein FJ405_18860, partial [Verrucomicrobia bacterium]|nr:hypothetical protein [Verrucomicrobiota bacterium]
SLMVQAACMIGLVLSGDVLAQESPFQRHAMATNHLKAAAVRMSDRCLAEVRTLRDWESQRLQRKAELLDMLGLNPMPKRTPLHPQITGTLDLPTYRIEKLVYQSSPRLYVSANFYVPKGAPDRKPVILYLCGHSAHPQGAKTQYQDRCHWFASRGYAVLVLDTLEFGEIPGAHHGTHNLNLWHWLSLGYTPAGVEVWNAIRALDYLETRKEVDMKRVGLTGISGGGAMTWYTAAVDERVSVAAPSCSTFTYGNQAEHWLAAGQCDCIYYHNTYEWDFPVVGALIAPRPLIILSGQKDTIFPPDGYHAAFQRTKRVYDLYAAGDSDRIKEVDEAVPHSDSPLLLAEARQWMNRWLKNDPSPVPVEPKPPGLQESPKALACLATAPSDNINDRIHDEFVALPEARIPKSRAQWEKRKDEIMDGLRRHTFGRFPTERAPFEAKPVSGGGGWARSYAEFKEVSLVSEPGVRIRVQRFLPAAGATKAPLLVHVKRAGDSIYSSDYDELLPLLGRAWIVIVMPRFTEHSFGAAERADIERTAAWTGRTIASMQVWDVLRAIHWAITEEKMDAGRVMVSGRGEAGAVALYAALMEQRVSGLILADPPSSHWQGPAMLNVLRVTDLPEAAAMMAPRSLVFLRALTPGYERTRETLRATRSAGTLRIHGSLASALSLDLRLDR